MQTLRDMLYDFKTVVIWRLLFIMAAMLLFIAIPSAAADFTPPEDYQACQIIFSMILTVILERIIINPKEVSDEGH